MAMLNRSLRAPSQRPASNRCPVLEIGRNSVTPSMMPRRRAARRELGSIGSREWGMRGIGNGELNVIWRAHHNDAEINRKHQYGTEIARARPHHQEIGREHV